MRGNDSREHSVSVQCMLRIRCVVFLADRAPARFVTPSQLKRMEAGSRQCGIALPARFE